MFIFVLIYILSIIGCLYENSKAITYQQTTIGPKLLFFVPIVNTIMFGLSMLILNRK